jgi:hypothetical protein
VKLPPARTCTFREDILDVRFAPRENIRDVTFREDRSQIAARGAHVLATLRNIVAALFRLNGRGNIAHSRRDLAWDRDNAVLQLLGVYPSQAPGPHANYAPCPAGTAAYPDPGTPPRAAATAEPGDVTAATWPPS